MRNLSKVLVANRGEIACRILRAARDLGYRTVAVYSDADRGAPHVGLADESVGIGAGPAKESYLDAARLVAAARATGADAVHPGYGFLSENAAFAEACAAAGIVFVGPPPEAIRLMGDKALAKVRMEGSAVGPVPGYAGSDQSPARLAKEAGKIGFPLLVKAVAGGGGRGIRVVRSASELESAVDGARREAESAFGDGTVLLERFVAGGRHVEIQVFADTHGNAVYLGERDCSTQRRRQKVIEEAPSPIVSELLRARMGAAAVEAALRVGYVGAGTIEYMVDAAGNAFFLEMNTRLQVEHPVTECITGKDLVRLQFWVAEGKPLPFTQDDVKLTGHAIEARLYAEDPYASFAPQTGTVGFWEPERATALPGVRIDDGIARGTVVSPYYDAMVAKVIAHGGDRDEAIRRLLRALGASPLFGVTNNRTFLLEILRSAEFQGARMTTTTLDEWLETPEKALSRPAPPVEAWALAAVLRSLDTASAGSGEFFHSSGRAALEVTLDHRGDRRTLAVTRTAKSAIVALPRGDVVTFEGVEVQGGDVHYSVVVSDVGLGVVGKRAIVHRDGRAVHLSLEAGEFTFIEPSPVPERTNADDPHRVRAPLAGVLAAVFVADGSVVKQGDTLGTVEAMKMETRLFARIDGVVTVCYAKAGDSVEAGTLLFEIGEPDDKP
jgi:geranyl-CoA carboxylase alpha subunit